MAPIKNHKLKVNAEADSVGGCRVVCKVISARKMAGWLVEEKRKHGALVGLMVCLHLRGDGNENFKNVHF